MLAFISDIHSNVEALTVCLQEIEKLGADRIVCLGDVIGYGPQPRDTLRTIMQRAEFSLLGNHEHGAMFYASDFNPRARAVAMRACMRRPAMPVLCHESAIMMPKSQLVASAFTT